MSEITWLPSESPLDIQSYWESEYPEIVLYERYHRYCSYEFYVASRI